MSQLIRIRTAEPTQTHKVRLTFTDGTVKEVDLSPFLHGPVFDPIKADLEVFRTLNVDPRMGTIVWPNGADIDPDVLYHDLQPAWMENERHPAR